MWQILDTQSPTEAWKGIFGKNGERGEYMDGYTPQAMLNRCQEDYKWSNAFQSDQFESQRSDMMSHLYDNQQLWTAVCMVAFAEHYVLTSDDEKETTTMLKKPFHTFQRHKAIQSQGDEPIFSGVVLSNWKSYDETGIANILTAFKGKGIDYVRLECNFGSAEDIGGPDQLRGNPLFGRLAAIAKECQNQGMVAVILIQVPWREEQAYDYFERAIECFANASKTFEVEPQKIILETRPPIGISAREERGLRSGPERISLGLETGRKMFDAIAHAFGGGDNDDGCTTTITGFCVAGGSTKGEFPTAMEDDTQNGVRQGMRQSAQQQWGYGLCFWEMGAKLMLQPKVGRLWGDNTQSGRDAARELFRINAEDMANEIKTPITQSHSK